MTKPVYEHDGEKHPLQEGDYDTAFKVYKTDRLRAEIANPEKCIEALGLRRLPNVAFAHIGSGNVAYVGFHDQRSPTGVTVRRFYIPAPAKKVRDQFETKGSPKTQILMLKAPANGKTMASRSKRDQARRANIKAGAHLPQKREQPHSTRLERIGVAHRPRPKIIKGEVSLGTE